jgi:hypothetical protein
MRRSTKGTTWRCTCDLVSVVSLRLPDGSAGRLSAAR